MGAWPLGGNLSYYGLLRALASDSSLCAIAMMLTVGMILSVAVIWVWCQRGTDGRMKEDSKATDAGEQAGAERDGMLDGAQASQAGQRYRWPTRF